MRWQSSALWMFIGSTVLGFFITTSLLVNSIDHIRSSLTKFYLAVWMALWMVILELYMFPDSPFIAYLVVFIAIILIFFLARRQTFVGDRQYLKAMIQHHSSAILTSERILEKTEDKEVRKLAIEIIDSQQREIDLMNRLLSG